MDVDFGSLLFSFQGRINRAKYWIATITYISVTIALVGLGFFFRFDTIFFIIAAIVFVAVTVSGVAVGLKRLHDRDMSGWWLLVFYLLPAVLDGIGRATWCSNYLQPRGVCDLHLGAGGARLSPRHIGRQSIWSRSARRLTKKARRMRRALQFDDGTGSG